MRSLAFLMKSVDRPVSSCSFSATASRSGSASASPLSSAVVYSPRAYLRASSRKASSFAGGWGRGRREAAEAGKRGRDPASGQVVAGPGEERLDVEGARHQDDAVEGHVLPRLQAVHDARRPGRAVALPEQELGRAPAVVVADVLLDEAADRVDVRIHAPEILVLR